MSLEEGSSHVFLHYFLLHNCSILEPGTGQHKLHLTTLKAPGKIQRSSQPHLFIWGWEFNLSVNTSWSQKSRIQDVYAVCCHDNLDVLSCFKPIKLVQQFQHGSLYLTVTCFTNKYSLKCQHFKPEICLENSN